MYEQDNDTAHKDAEDANADAFFNEFAGEGTAAPNEREADDGEASDEGEDQARDNQGRFASDDQNDGDDGDGSDAQGDDENPDDELERLRQEAQQWQHRYQSDIGRVNAYQRKIQELEQQNQQLSQRSAASKGNAAGESAENPQGSGMTDEAWQNFKEDFPDMAQAMEKRLSSISQHYEQRIGQLESQLTPIQQRAEQQAVEGEIKALSERHPDYAEYAAPEGVPVDQLGPKAQQFQAWLQRQPDPVRQMLSSNSAADAAYLLDSFKRESDTQPSNQGLQQRRNRRLTSVFANQRPPRRKRTNH